MPRFLASVECLARLPTPPRMKTRLRANRLQSIALFPQPANPSPVHRGSFQCLTWGPCRCMVDRLTLAGFDGLRNSLHTAAFKTCRTFKLSEAHMA